jgi:hypothetical protein
MEELKSFRIASLQTMLDRLNQSLIGCIFDCLCQLIQQLKPTDMLILWSDTATIRDDLSENTGDLCQTIKYMIERSEFLDLDLVQEEWHYWRSQFDGELAAFTWTANNLIEQYSYICWLSKSELYLQIFKAVTPIIKLSRLFFRKLCHQLRNPPEFFTDLCSSQIMELCGECGKIHPLLAKFEEWM